MNNENNMPSPPSSLPEEYAQHLSQHNVNTPYSEEARFPASYPGTRYSTPTTPWMGGDQYDSSRYQNGYGQQYSGQLSSQVSSLSSNPFYNGNLQELKQQYSNDCYSSSANPYHVGGMVSSLDFSPTTPTRSLTH
jgi:hypothetical protein